MKRAMTSGLVFCFGSNLSQRQMLRRCPRAVYVGVATLHGYRLAFRGHSAGWGGAVATVVPAKGRRVVGTVFVIGPMDLMRLDRCEGHPWCYRRNTMRVTIGHKRTKVNAWVYVRQGGEYGVPAHKYLDTISKAYERFSFDRRLLIASLVYSRERMYDEQQRQEFPFGDDDELLWLDDDFAGAARAG